MRFRTTAPLTLVVLCGCFSLTASAQSASARRRAEAARLVNPVAVDDATLDQGRRIYFGECAACHGLLADGDSKMQWSLDPVPPSLVDNETKFGASDGEMFVVVRDGVDHTSMRPYSDRLTEPQMWAVVNYIRTLAPQITQH
jgi:mono/diheme cytochrome c family protein